MSLTRIKIKGFRSIREMDLPLKPLNVLIAAQNAFRNVEKGLIK